MDVPVGDPPGESGATHWATSGASPCQSVPSEPGIEVPELTPEEHRAAAATALDAAGEEGLAGIVRAWAELPEAVRLALATLAGGQS